MAGPNIGAADGFPRTQALDDGLTRTEELDDNVDRQFTASQYTQTTTGATGAFADGDGRAYDGAAARG